MGDTPYFLDIFFIDILVIDSLVVICLVLIYIRLRLVLGYFDGGRLKSLFRLGLSDPICS